MVSNISMMTRVHFSDGTYAIVYESAIQIIQAISAPYSWVRLSLKDHSRTNFVVNSNHIIYIEELKSGDVCD